MPANGQRQVRKPRKPFHFNTSESLLRIGSQKAENLSELLRGLETCPDDSIFQHTFRTLQEHHFIREGFTNDFAHWTLSSLDEPELARALAGIDVREFTSIESLRRRIAEILSQFLKSQSNAEARQARKPFYFCSSELVVLPTAFSPNTLEGFIDAIEKVSVHSIYYHFIEARLRIRRLWNDFSVWLEEEAGLKGPAEVIERLDIYNNSLEGVRLQIARIVSDAIH